MKQILYSRSRIIEALIHIIGWGIVFAFPFVMMTRSGFTITWMDYLRHGSIVPLSFLIVFYCNYCFLIPRYLFEGRIRQYLLLNILLIACVTAGVHFWQEYAFHTYAKADGEGQRHIGPPKWIFIMRDFFSMILTVGLSAAIRLSGRWVQVEAARRYNKEFGKFKVIFDFTLVTVAIILSLIFTQRIEGVREGSLIAACITGYIVSFLNNKIMTRKMLSRVSSILSNLAFNTNINCIHSPQTAFKFKSNDVGFRNIGQCIITNMKKILLVATKVFDKTISF